MGCKVAHRSEVNIIEVVCEGTIDLASVLSGMEATLRMAQQTQCYRVLSDLSNSELQLSLLEIYNFPRAVLDIASSLGINAHLLKRGVVMKPETLDAHFLETVCRNRGLHTKLFLNRVEAISWLSAEQD